ncbi:hypothetical protein J6590_001944 [Homalodisca vitripennis]|nr:hypothetical protein J6590_001944 [Homalodisca vitripennis]
MYGFIRLGPTGVALSIFQVGHLRFSGSQDFDMSVPGSSLPALISLQVDIQFSIIEHYLTFLGAQGNGIASSKDQNQFVRPRPYNRCCDS